ncbi:hypothetical protein E2J97_04200 [Vibrio cholerae]|uniref:hypothetical protein n=1 Tax=Vibrio cholerae TaxID=666 RepID=UPI0011D59B8F|nr:hypothetical protein [Vibrio cholerae]EGR0494701.1 hypothetical protein [Vibrio cholerae]EGR0664496.1 hypothetical protein [Vibrio cholerae]EGR4106703.1 hypothetical protein [Vibrio cholerae]EGR4124659.1 hypothetical protein [Vibrio cholerae]EGR4279540.1 hypothetical protein [Vibrio cholerae]
MPRMYINEGGAWKAVKKPSIKINQPPYYGVYQPAKKVFIKVEGIWKEVYTAFPGFYTADISSYGSWKNVLGKNIFGNGITYHPEVPISLRGCAFGNGGPEWLDKAKVTAPSNADYAISTRDFNMFINLNKQGFGGLSASELTSRFVEDFNAGEFRIKFNREGKSAYFGSDKCIAKILGSSSDARVKIEQKSIVEGQFNNEWNVLTFGMSASKPVLNTIGVTV